MKNLSSNAIQFHFRFCLLAVGIPSRQETIFKGTNVPSLRSNRLFKFCHICWILEHSNNICSMVSTTVRHSVQYGESTSFCLYSRARVGITLCKILNWNICILDSFDIFLARVKNVFQENPDCRILSPQECKAVGNIELLRRRIFLAIFMLPGKPTYSSLLSLCTTCWPQRSISFQALGIALQICK